MVFEGFQGKAARRAMLKRALKASAYAVPVVLATAIPLTAGAVTGPTGPSLSVVPASGGGGTVFAFYGMGFAPNTNYDVRLLIISTGVNPGPFPVTSNAFGALAFGGDTAGIPSGMYGLGIALRGTRQFLAQIAFTVTLTFVPTTPGLLVGPTSGPVGTVFSFSAGGFTPYSAYKVLYTAVPPGASTGVADPGESSTAFGQFGFQIDSSTLVPGIYTLGVAAINGMTIIAQTTINVTGTARSGVTEKAAVTGGTSSQFKFAS